MAEQNAYGFDFLRREHTLDDDGRPREFQAEPEEMIISSSGPVPDAENKPDLEKQFLILGFLQEHRGSGCLAPNVIYKETGVDLELESNANVVEMLQNNPKVMVELVPDPENPALMVPTYAYQAKYANVRDRTTLLAQINRMTSGVPMRDLLDSYSRVEQDLQGLITAGDVIACHNNEDRDKILFPRGESFLVELDGLITLPTPPKDTAEKASDTAPDEKDSKTDAEQMPPPREVVVVETDIDPRRQIRRGEAVQVGGQWFRVSSAVKDGPLSDQPVRAQAPLSVVSLEEMSRRNELDGYIRPFSDKELPLDAALTEESKKNLQAAKDARESLLRLVHGRSTGATGQLLGSHAHSSNPATMAKSLVSASNLAQGRKRPNARISSSQSFQRPHHQQIPKDGLAKAAANPALALYGHARRHGVTLDVREMYLATRKLVPESDHDLLQLLLKHKLMEPGEKLRRDRLTKTGSNVDNDGKPKKRRYYERKNQRMTNTHLDGTELGILLHQAAEKQKQGKSVGDGGM